MILIFGFCNSLIFAQPPGATPPKQIFESNGEEDSDGLPIRAFMFLSESENQVMMPGLTWEEFERLLDRDAGMDAANQSFSYQFLEIRGSTDQDRAELDVVLRVSIEPTEGRWVKIPLRMGNFHRLAPPDVSGVDEYFMSLAPDDSGYLLFVKTNERDEALLRMRVSARVGNNSGVRSLAFQLPDVPAKVELTADAENISGEVIGRGDEALAPAESVAGGRTKFVVDSGGGTFSFRWGNLVRSTDELSLLEVESRVVVRWDSPQDLPIASVRLTVKNVRGSIDSFQLRLPPGSVVLEPPRLGSNGQRIELATPTNDRDGEIREVIIPEDERQSRLDLNFDLQLANENASATSPLGFRVPQVVGALRHRGEIEIQTGGDYRLRWRARAWVRSELGESREEGASGRIYRFRFDRASFQLPLWLGEKERQLRMVIESQITMRESIADLRMTIQVEGQTSDGRLRLDEASWQLNSIEDLLTGQSLESQVDSYRVIEFNAGGVEQTTSIQIRAEHPLGPGKKEIRLPIPRVVKIDETALIQSATVTIVNSGRSMLVVDLDASDGLSRIIPSAAETTSDSPITSFRVATQDSPALIAGTIVDQPPRIILASDAAVELDGEQLITTVIWTVSSALDLEGRLPIRIPSSSAVISDESGQDDEVMKSTPESPRQVGDPPSDEQVAPDESWTVRVNEQPATLKALGGDRYDLISDRLASGAMTIRWYRMQELRSGVTAGAIELVPLPRPSFEDVTVRGAMQVALRGNQQRDLVAVDSPTSNRLELESLPRDPIRLRLESRLIKPEELSIRQTILRTVVGRNTRHEQVLATIQGGDQFRVGLPDAVGEVSVEAFIDGRSISPQRDGDSLVVSLPGDKLSHIVDLRVWLASPTPSTWATIEPLLKLPIGTGRVFWQIVAPLDGHVVWASPTLGRSMSWRFDRWKLYREPSHGDQALTAMSGSSSNPLPPGNRYLYIGSDLRALNVVVVSRVALWMCIGSFVLLSAVLLINLPQIRHPLTAVLAAVLFGGLMAIAPDAAVLAGQFGIIALTLVIVMVAIRSVVMPSGSDRVFSSSRSTVPVTPPSTRSQKQPVVPERSAGGTTHTLPRTSPGTAKPGKTSPSEASP